MIHIRLHPFASVVVLATYAAASAVATAHAQAIADPHDAHTAVTCEKVIKRLLDAGISLQSARRALDVLRAAGEDVTTANLVLNGAQSVLAYTGEEIIDLLKGGQGVLNIVPLSGVISELQAAIHDLETPAPADGSVTSRAAGG